MEFVEEINWVSDEWYVFYLRMDVFPMATQ